jgi:uncharacterized protein (TIGR00730 family)
MADLADGFIAMPGGFGTAEEFFEALTWAQLGLHTKPCGLLNVKGYFNHLIRFVDHAVEEQFIDAAHRALLLVDDLPEALLDKLASWKAQAVDKAAWATKLIK